MGTWRFRATRLAGESDPASWERAVATWEEQAQPYPAAYARLRQAEGLRRVRLLHAALSMKLHDANHQVGPQLQVLGLGLVEPEIDEDIAATPSVFELFSHRCLLSRTSVLNLRRASSISVRAVLRDFF